MAITHVVTFAWADGTDPALVGSILADLRAFIDRGEGLDGLLAWQAGPDLGLAATNASFGVSATFADLPAFERYRDHPQHRAIITERIAPIAASRTAVQFEH